MTSYRHLGKALCAPCVALALCLGVTEDAHATLGGDVPSIRANLASLGATLQLATSDRHELVLPSGTVVREYVSPAGVVYAISWRGSGLANLRELLGPYFAQVEHARHSGGHHLLNLVGTDLVVRAMGHRHSFAGHAWVPSLVPAGVDAGVLP